MKGALPLTLLVALLPALACNGGAESCATCGYDWDGSVIPSGTAGKTGAAGTGVSGVGGRGGATGVAGTSASAGTTGAAGTAAGRGGTTGAAGTSAGAGTTGAAGTSAAGGRGGTTGAAGTSAAGTTGAAGTSAGAGTTGAAGTSASAGTTGAAGTSAAGGTTGVAGTSAAGGTTGVAGTSAAAGRGGTTGAAGTMAAAGRGGNGGSSVDPDLVLWYKFDDGSGTSAADSSGNSRTGTLTNVGGGTAAFSTTNKVPPGAVNLTSSSSTVGGYVRVPASMQTMGATTAVTISTWVNVRTGRDWARVFDFSNTSTTGYMFLTTQQATATPASTRFAITTTSNSNEQIINMTTPAALSAGWHHLAVVLGAGTTYTGTLYIDKVAAGSNNTMTLRPSSIGNTANNFIGRSAYPADPYFDGYIDDFRIYKRALTAAEISALP